jgi:1-acyl-sn-glycerol-3-phosphate acyltransferase
MPESILRMRAVCRLALIVGWSIVMALARVAVMPLRLYDPAAEIALHQRMMKVWARGFLWGFGMRVNTIGTPPTGAFLFVANHWTWIDVVVLASQLGTVFLSKAEVAKYPLIGQMAGAAGTIFITRESLKDIKRVQDKVEASIKRGHGVAVFPEGGTSQSGHTESFRPAMLEIAVRNEWPVYYGAIQYRTPEGYPPASEVIEWRGPVPLLTNALAVLRLPHSYATLKLGDEPMRSSDRKELAARLTEAVRENLKAIA